MEFPVYIRLFGHTIHPHLFMELLAYPAGFQLWLFLRRRDTPARLPLEPSLWMIAGAILGAAAGSKLLAWLEDWPLYLAHAGDWRAWVGGKTIVGGLLGGWAGVEIAKRKLRVTRRTGDVYVFPLIVGMILGRVGCFLTGLQDKTYGIASSLPWAVDFGDGVPRHPTQLYEIAFLLLLGASFIIQRRRAGPPGHRFRLFLLGYLTFRFGVEFIKPVYAPYLGLSAIQLACLLGSAAALRGILMRPPRTNPLTSDL